MLYLQEVIIKKVENQPLFLPKKLSQKSIFIFNKQKGCIDFDKICAKIGLSIPLRLNSYKSILNKEFGCPGFEFYG